MENARIDVVIANRTIGRLKVRRMGIVVMVLRWLKRDILSLGYSAERALRVWWNVWERKRGD